MNAFLATGLLCSLALLVAFIVGAAVASLLYAVVRAVVDTRAVMREIADRPRARARERWSAALRRWW